MRELLISAGYEIRSYSGRGMFGTQCLSVVTNDGMPTFMCNVFRTILDMDYIDGVTDLISALEKTRCDSMGLSEVFYWPTIEWNEE